MAEPNNQGKFTVRITDRSARRAVPTISDQEIQRGKQQFFGIGVAVAAVVAVIGFLLIVVLTR